MPFLARLRSLGRNLLTRKQADRDLDGELQGFVEMLTDEKIRAGADPARARREALLETGGVEQVKEIVRDVRAGAFLETVFQDFRYGVRSLRKSPGFTAAAVVTLALGIGAASAIFSVVDAVLLRPLPYSDPGRLVVILHRDVDPVAPANFLDWRRQSTVFETMGAADAWSPNLIGGAESERVQALKITSEILPMLGVRPLLGRAFGKAEEEPGKDREAILSFGLWQRRFGGDRGILGRSIVLNGESFSIVGIMPRGFDFPPFWMRGVQLWVPLGLSDRAANRTGQSLRAFARLKPGVTLARARAEIGAITARLDKEFPGSNREVTVTRLEERVVGSVRSPLLILLGAVGFVLLISCANVAHMLLARAASRQKEVAIRTALGAGRSRMIRQFFTESLVLAGAGGVVGFALAVAGIRLLVALSPAGIPRVETIALDLRVLTFTLVVALATGVAFGLVPAFHSFRRDVTESLREGERGSSEGGARARLRSLLVASEFALALVLLVGAGLMIRTFLALESIDPGLDPHHVLTMTVSVAGTEVAQGNRRIDFYQRLLQNARALPGVVAASAINHLPLAGDIWGWSFQIAGRPIPRPGDSPGAAYRVVLPGYFKTMKIPILRGRDVTDADGLEAPGVVIVNEFLADHHFPGEDPLGKRITFDDQDKNQNPAWLTIVGVVKNVVREDWAAAPEEEIYLPYLQTRNYLQSPKSVYTYLTLVVRTGPDPSALSGALRQTISSLDRNATVAEIQTMEAVVSQANARPRFYLFLLGLFAVVALLLAAVGIYGVMSYAVSRRTHEIGIRMALGAEQGAVLRLVVSHGLLVALAGAAAGLVGALVLTRSMTTILYGVRPTDLPTFAVVSCLLTAVAVAASYLPARRAMRIDPMIALRHE